MTFMWFVGTPISWASMLLPAQPCCDLLRRQASRFDLQVRATALEAFLHLRRFELSCVKEAEWLGRGKHSGGLNVSNPAQARRVQPRNERVVALIVEAR